MNQKKRLRAVFRSFWDRALSNPDHVKYHRIPGILQKDLDDFLTDAREQKCFNCGTILTRGAIGAVGVKHSGYHCSCRNPECILKMTGRFP